MGLERFRPAELTERSGGGSGGGGGRPLAPPTPDNQVFRHVFCIDTETNPALDPT